MTLLTRDEFREGVFERDGLRCVICKADDSPAAHHVVERRLFDDGGYYLANGATLCPRCHIKAEQTPLSCDAIRDAAGIDVVILPEHLYPDEKYDKWSNIILNDGRRIQGELFQDLSVQKILREGGVLDQFLPYVKYPRTHHFIWSPGATKDDRIIRDLSVLENSEVVVTVKMDGENNSFYHDYYHARSLSSPSHPSQSWAKQWHASHKYDIPEGWRVCAENLYAEHTIHYQGLPSYLAVFSIWDDKNTCLSWDDTLEWCELLELPHVPILYRGPWDEELIKKLYQPTYNGNDMEGYVVRVTNSFHYAQFRRCVCKYVRAGHVSQHAKNWRSGPVVPNELAL